MGLITRGNFLLSACAVALTGLVVGCGGTSDNGVAGKSADGIVSAAMNAVNGVKSVHVAGAVRSGGSPTTLDLALLAGQGARGQLAEGGLSFRIISLNQVVYINGSDAFWRHFGGSAAVQLFHGKWLRAPASGQFGAVGSLTSLQTLFSRLLSNHGKLAKGSTTTVAGQKVIAVNDTTKGGTLYVATTGQPYPIEISNAGSQGGRIVFDRYNQAASITPPANSIDVSKLK
jgi:hypothetical protein